MFSHLDAQQMAALLKQYDVGEKIDPLLQEYAIRCSQRFLVTHLPPIIHEARCPYCDVPLQSPRVGRYRKHLKPIPPQCPLCFHRPGANCSCAPCDKQRKELLAQRCGASSPAPAPPARLSISQALYLCSVVAQLPTVPASVIRTIWVRASIATALA